MSIFPGQRPEPDPMVMIYQMGVAMRRLLIVVDNRKPAAKFASEVLRDADAMLQGQRPGGRRR